MGFLQYCSLLRDREFRRINEQNDNHQTPLDLSQSEERPTRCCQFQLKKTPVLYVLSIGLLGLIGKKKNDFI